MEIGTTHQSVTFNAAQSEDGACLSCFQSGCQSKKAVVETATLRAFSSTCRSFLLPVEI